MATMLSKELDLDAVDPEVTALVRDEYDRQAATICLIPSENYVSRAVLEALGVCSRTSIPRVMPVVAITKVSRSWTDWNPWPLNEPRGCSV